MCDAEPELYVERTNLGMGGEGGGPGGGERSKSYPWRDFGTTPPLRRRRRKKKKTGFIPEFLPKMSCFHRIFSNFFEFF